MATTRWRSLLEAAAIIGLITLALVLRSDWSYRTASGAEATHLFGGWQALRGEETYTLAFQPGWPYLSMAPLAWADVLGGLAAARALSAAWGILTVLLAMLTARRLYGQPAGLIAGGLVAVFGPAIHLSTSATPESLGVFFVSAALYLWVAAMTGERAFLYLFVGLALTLATLTHYVALVAALVLVVFLAALTVAAAVARRRGRDDRLPAWWAGYTNLVPLIGVVLPLLALIPYVLSYQRDLTALWQSLLLARQPGLGDAWATFKPLRNLVGLPFLAAVLAFDGRARHACTAGLFLVGLGFIAYQFWSQDGGALVRLTTYSVAALAPLVGGGLATLGQGWGNRPLARLAMPVVALLGLGLVGYVGWQGQADLSGNRYYWPDTAPLIEYLRNNVADGDVVLMEQGVVGRYYLIAHATPGHIPGQIWDTWWYQDEEGQGAAAALFERAIRQGRFEVIVFDYSVTGDLDRALVPAIGKGYDLAVTFPSGTSLSERIDVYRRR